MKKIVIFVLFLLFFLTASVFAEEKTISVNGMYIAGASESLNDAKQNALEDAMRQAAEQAGVLVNSYSKTHNMELTDDEVIVVATKIIKIMNKKFDVKLLSDSEIKVIAYIDVLFNTDSINNDILELKKKNIKLEEEKAVIMKRQQTLEDLHNLVNEIRKEYKGKFDLYEKEEARKKLTPDSYYGDALTNFRLDMKKGDYNAAHVDIAIASLNYKKMVNVSKEIRSFYVDEKVCDFEIKRIESYIAGNDFSKAMEECVYFIKVIEKNNYSQNLSDEVRQKIYRYSTILANYHDMYEPEKWNAIMENPGFPRIG